ncbi:MULTISPECIES: peptidylprolyl isomerase [Salimicrobium]|uniref:Foldase protein PrsA n=4 Tax=Salimicrobium TaxID=351195 RepID=K2GJR1_9BACI|nr:MULTISPECIES: peptidylprolyl isomerase [Salimicrobium]AKG05018.1 foldase [Salimicrobium jeotgali]EKE30674.1 peptidyl-prolyl isomerase [Salimicrobium jeotgali]MBM7696909.1 foldase protein PrsA [Salimicrobium jeotgali]PBB05406.1 foldase [Salimicrobium humidisoli]SDX47166.1 foldase protein PrsA [Salimicrobium album]
MKKAVLTTILATSVFTLAACSSDDSSETVAETANSEITKEEFYNELKNKHGEEVLQQLVTNEVLTEKYDVSDEAVQKEVDALKEQYGDQFDQALESSGFEDVDAFKETIRQSLLQEQAAAETVDISEKEMKDYYERMKTEVQASHILVEDKETAEEVKKKLADGAEFSELASEYSSDGSAQQGGKLGYFGPGEMAQEFEAAAYKLDKGEISEPVQSQFGYHIIKVTDKRDAEDVKPYEEAKPEIKRTLVSQKVDQQKMQQHLQKIMDEAEIDVKLEEFEGLFKQESAEEGSGDSEEDGSSEE